MTVVMCWTVEVYDVGRVEVCTPIDEVDALSLGVWIVVDTSFSEDRLLVCDVATDIIGAKVVLWKDRFSKIGRGSANRSSIVESGLVLWSK